VSAQLPQKRERPHAPEPHLHAVEADRLHSNQKCLKRWRGDGLGGRSRGVLGIRVVNVVGRIRLISSVVNKDLTFKAKAKAKDLTSEQVEGQL